MVSATASNRDVACDAPDTICLSNKRKAGLLSCQFHTRGIPSIRPSERYKEGSVDGTGELSQLINHSLTWVISPIMIYKDGSKFHSCTYARGKARNPAMAKHAKGDMIKMHTDSLSKAS